MSDKQKINDLYIRIRDFKFPVCESETMKELVKEVKEGFDIILIGIKNGTKKIS